MIIVIIIIVVFATYKNRSNNDNGFQRRLAIRLFEIFVQSVMVLFNMCWFCLLHYRAMLVEYVAVFVRPLEGPRVGGRPPRGPVLKIHIYIYIFIPPVYKLSSLLIVTTNNRYDIGFTGQTPDRADARSTLFCGVLRATPDRAFARSTFFQCVLHVLFDFAYFMFCLSFSFELFSICHYLFYLFLRFCIF